MVTEGFTAKFAPLALDPIVDPPEGSVYQSMLLPVEVAVRSETPPGHIFVGEAVTEIGASGKPTVTVTGVLVADGQPEPKE